MATEQFAARFAERVLAARRLVILATLVLVAAASSGIAFLEFSANYRIFFDEDNPQLLALEALENTYGKNENVVFLIVPDDGDATSQSALSAAVWLTDAAWYTPFSRRVDSLANFQHTTADGDDLYVRDLVDPQELTRAEARSRIRSNRVVRPPHRRQHPGPQRRCQRSERHGRAAGGGSAGGRGRSGRIRQVGRRGGRGTISRRGPAHRRHGHDQPDLRRRLDRQPDDLPARKPPAHGRDPRRRHPRLGGGGGDRDGHRLFHSRVGGPRRMGRPALFPTHLAGIRPSC